MNVNRFAKGVAVTAGLFLACAAPGLNRAQSSPPRPVPSPPKVSPAAGPKGDASQTGVFAELKLTDEQKARIDEIHRIMTSRMDVVIKDEKLNADQKEAMIQGYQHMENTQAFEVLTPSQRREFREKTLVRSAAQQQKQASPK